MADPDPRPTGRELGRGLRTRVLPVDPLKLGQFTFPGPQGESLNDWTLSLEEHSPDAKNLLEAAELLRTTTVPVAFPTETVYGLGADATRSSAVRGIYEAKQRPSDNPLIVHICSLAQLRGLLRPGSEHEKPRGEDCPANGLGHGHLDGRGDVIPEIYGPLIRKFWPGPLTIILPNPENSVLAPEVTAGLSTFGARMPKNLLALAIIKLAGVPLAAPSANASTRPSPTAAEHVHHDLDGRISVIIDGGPCDIGVESTVVDGLSDPPLILRPGGISVEQLRQCEGWENVALGYRDAPELCTKPKAPGMKYKHYSPKALVVLHEAGSSPPSSEDMIEHVGRGGSIGLIRTRTWSKGCDPITQEDQRLSTGSRQEMSSDVMKQDGNYDPSRFGVTNGSTLHPTLQPASTGSSFLLLPLANNRIPSASHSVLSTGVPHEEIIVWEIALGQNTDDIARGLFSALRELDGRGVDVIFVEGIADDEDVAAAVMNRLRKAAGARIS